MLHQWGRRNKKSKIITRKIAFQPVFNFPFLNFQFLTPFTSRQKKSSSFVFVFFSLDVSSPFSRFFPALVWLKVIVLTCAGYNKQTNKKKKVSDVFFFNINFCPLEFVRELIEGFHMEVTENISIAEVVLVFRKQPSPPLSSKKKKLFMNITTRKKEMITHKWK